MKKLAMLLAALTFAFTLSARAEGEIPVTLDDKQLVFEQQPIIRNDSTLVPMRVIFEELGMTVTWDGDSRSVTATDGQDVIEMRIDNNIMTVNSEKKELNTPPIIYNDYTLVPLRAVSEAAGATVQWDSGARSVTITSAKRLREWAHRVVQLTNDERAKYDLDPLKWDNTLETVARAHCADMIDRGFFDHVNPDGDDPSTRMKKAGIAYWLSGENIAAKQKTPEIAVKQWMQSALHRENILNPAYESIAVCVMTGGEHGIYWVQEFALLK